MIAGDTGLPEGRKSMIRPLDGKVLGVIGGMGPLATDFFYNMVIEMTDASCDQEHINMIILNHATMPDRTEAILSGHGERVAEKLYKDALFLQEGGACCIAVPCNTSHFVLDQVAGKIDIPVINMIREGVGRVIDYCSRQGIEKEDIKAGIMATDGTVRFGLYQKAFAEEGIEVVLPGEESQKKVMKIIYEGIKENRGVDRKDFDDVADELKEKGCSCILLACTELSVYKMQEKLDDFYVDAMEALAEKAVEMCGGIRKNQ